MSNGAQFLDSFGGMTFKESSMQTQIKALADAWFDAGPRPDIHDRAKARLREEWPTLFRVVQDIASGVERNPDLHLACEAEAEMRETINQEQRERIALLEQAVETTSRPIHIDCTEAVHKTVVSAMAARVGRLEASLGEAQTHHKIVKGQRNQAIQVADMLARRLETYIHPGALPAPGDVEDAEALRAYRALATVVPEWNGKV